MGDVIDITGHLAARQHEREKRLVPFYPDWGSEWDVDEAEVARDLLAEMQDARERRLCDTCGTRRAVAEVYRSDAVEAGLGGMLQCRRCLIEEIRYNRDDFTTRDACRRVDRLLEHADSLLVRIEIRWDPKYRRAVELDGVRLP